MRAAIFGATGMVGGEVLEQCLANYRIKRVLAIGRRKSGVEHSKLKEIEHNDFLDFTALEDELADVDVCFYCLGVYQAQVSKAQFWEITVDYLEALVYAFERTNKNVRFCLRKPTFTRPSLTSGFDPEQKCRGSCFVRTGGIALLRRTARMSGHG